MGPSAIVALLILITNAGDITALGLLALRNVAMKKICAPVGLILTAILISNCTQVSERPDIQEPEPVSLPSDLENRCSGGEVLISSDTDSTRFEGCTVFVKESV